MLVPSSIVLRCFALAMTAYALGIAVGSATAREQSSRSRIVESRQVRDKLFIYGPTDEAMLRAFSAAPQGSSILLASPGGRTDIAIAIGKIVLQNSLSLEVGGVCLSSCADYILPAAKAVKLQSGSVIGFHHNDLLFEYLLRRQQEPADRCLMADVRWLDYLYKVKRLKSEFATLERARRLDVSRVISIPGPNCAFMYTLIKRTLWLPTSDQLRQLWGLSFNGSVCADHPACRRSLLPQVFKPGTRLMVGDDDIVVQEQSKSSPAKLSGSS